MACVPEWLEELANGATEAPHHAPEEEREVEPVPMQTGRWAGHRMNVKAVQALRV